ncbi:MAG: tetratricopeptide repeat protein [Gemmatimonadales bacterium]
MPFNEALFAVLSGGVEGWLTWSFARGTLSLPSALAIHGAVVAVLAAWIYTLRWHGAGLRIASLLGITTAALGPLGPLGTLLTLGFYLWFRRGATPFDEWYFSLFPEPEVSPALELYRDIVLGRDDRASERSIASFTDILVYGSVAQKQALIGLLANHYRPAFAPALHAALSHEDPSIRVQAATAATIIENRYAAQAERLNAAVNARPQDLGARLELARFYDDYAFSGLLDAVRQHDNRIKTLELYKECSRLAPANAEIIGAIGRLYVRLGDDESARVVMEKIQGTASPANLFWYLEVLFRLRRLDRLRDLMRLRRETLLDHVRRNPALADVVELWAPSSAGMSGT